ncbi:MAG TPA: hypothetical protein VE967_18160 [Gemmatimonadaceae bacterium]|nr:hypothetical protein [Gemmatimonadaceae bacterium]
MQNRRRFLQTLGGTTAAAAASAVPAAAAPLHATLREPATHPAPADGAFDVSWADRVTGKFRAVFDSPQLAEGSALFRAILWCDEYKQVYGTPRTDMSPVVVFRHEAIPAVMGDEYWQRYKVGKETKMKDPGTKKWAVTNPWRVSPPGTPEQYAAYNIEAFLKSGGIILACNLAFGEVVATVMKAEKLDGKAARERAISMLIPGVLLQPSGVFAALRAQEAGCRYILAS